MNVSKELKKLFVLEYIINNKNKGFSQNHLSKELYPKFELSTILSTKMILGNLLKQMQLENLVYYEVGGKRFIKSHIWYATQTGINKLENYKKKIRGD